MNCQCCKNQKARLHKTESTLIKGNELILCTSCLNDGHEPRHNIIIASYSNKSVAKYIINDLYCGNKLTAQEVIHKL